ncbi:MAG: hypothetical protein HYS55_02090 [Candidatus Omnitrophica bacterium]|nr:hypothetical protein [Candidatus Omnitrophota bacterium]
MAKQNLHNKILWLILKKPYLYCLKHNKGEDCVALIQVHLGVADTLLRNQERTVEKPFYTCSACQWTGDEEKFSTKILSIMYRPKHDNIQAFKQIKCPKCRSLVTIVFETLDGTLAK